MLYPNSIDISGTALGRQWSQDVKQNFKSGEDFLYNLYCRVGWFFLVVWGFFFFFRFQEIYPVQLNYLPKMARCGC